MTTRINWNPKEIAKLAPRIAAAMSAGASILQAVHTAQEVLAKKRRRTFDSRAKIYQNKPLIQAIEAAGLGLTPGTLISVEASVTAKDAVQTAEPPTAVANQKPKPLTRSYPKTHILWNDDEEQKLIDGAVLELHAGAKNILNAVRRAQFKVLPEGRQRKITTIGNIPKTVIQRTEVKFLTAPTPSETPTAEPQAPEPTPPVVSNPVEDWLREIATLPTKLAGLIADFDKRLSSVEYSTMLVLETVSGHKPDEPHKIQEQDIIKERLDRMRKTTKRKIVIVGQKTVQFQEVEKRWGEHFHLHHISSASGDSFSLERLKHADYVIGVTNFMNHSTQNRIRSVVPKGHYFFASSPVGDVCAVLQSIFLHLDLVAAQTAQPVTNGVAANH